MRHQLEVKLVQMTFILPMFCLGNASILSTQLNTSRRKFLQQIGYCPQFDSIIPQLTGRELLTLMCRVRGVQAHRVGREVQRWTNFLGKHQNSFSGFYTLFPNLGIQEYIERESGSYSGGNKRKLNVAMALVRIFSAYKLYILWYLVRLESLHLFSLMSQVPGWILLLGGTFGKLLRRYRWTDSQLYSLLTGKFPWLSLFSIIYASCCLQYGGVRGSLWPACHHGQRSVPVLRYQHSS